MLEKRWKIRKSYCKKLIAVTFPNYGGRKFECIMHDSMVLSDLNWSGGTRSVYIAVRVGDGETRKVPNHMAPWDNMLEGKAVAIPDGMVIVEHTVFCGTDMGLRFHFNTNMVRALPEA